MEPAKAKKAIKMAKDFMADVAIEDQMDAVDELMAKASQPDLQPEDGYINPMGRIGTVPPSTYSLGNMLNGTTTQSVINPET